MTPQNFTYGTARLSRYGLQTLVLAGMMLFGITAVAVPDAEARVKPRPVVYDCRDLLASSAPAKVVWGRFVGVEEIMGYEEDFVRPISVEACFTSVKQCDLWLYWMKSDFPLNMRHARCNRGYNGYLIR